MAVPDQRLKLGLLSLFAPTNECLRGRELVEPGADTIEAIESRNKPADPAELALRFGESGRSVGRAEHPKVLGCSDPRDASLLQRAA